MPPKKGNKASKKTKEKVKSQKLEDKTFGLKNKNKSKAVQKYVQHVEKTIKGDSAKARDANKRNMSAKAAKAAKAEQMADLFKAAITQPKVPPGVDPKSVVCEFFKQNCCAKGNRCKFSHDLNAGRKTAKIDLYTDARANDKMEDWDQRKLEEVITEKHGAANQTDIVCKYFLDAIEKSQYGWFWTCPNDGKACKYRHALPPGFVYKTREEREAERAEKENKICIEHIIEEQRAKLGATGGTPVTAETLAVWKEEKAKRKAAAVEEKRKAEVKKSGGRGLNVLSGRALFTYDPSLFRDDDEADQDEYDEADRQEEDSEAVVSPPPAPARSPNDDGVDAAAKSMDQSLYLKDDVNLDEIAAVATKSSS